MSLGMEGGARSPRSTCRRLARLNRRSVSYVELSGKFSSLGRRVRTHHRLRSSWRPMERVWQSRGDLHVGRRRGVRGRLSARVRMRSVGMRTRMKRADGLDMCVIRRDQRSASRWGELGVWITMWVEAGMFGRRVGRRRRLCDRLVSVCCHLALICLLIIMVAVTPLSGALLPTRTPERSSFSVASPTSQQRPSTNLRAIPRRTTSGHGSYVSRPSSIEIIETAATPVDSPSYRAFELHRRSASTGVPGFPWSHTSFGTTSISNSPEQSDGDSHYELNSRTAPLSRITTAPSKIGNAIGNAFARDPDYEPTRRKKLKRFVKQLAGAAVV
jgi:hypothetical protein